MPHAELDMSRRDKICSAFSAAERYDQHASVQRLTADDLAKHIVQLGLPQDPRVCDIGCGTGFLSAALGARVAGGAFLASDISEAMLLRARQKLGGDRRFSFAVVNGEDPQALSGRGPFDLICSSFAAQWFSDLPRAIARLFEHLAPGGRLVIATLAEGTFQEWGEAHRRLGLSAGTPIYPALADLQATAPPGVSLDVQLHRRTEQFSAATDFLRSLRAIGATTPAPGRRPLAAPQLRRVLREFEALGARCSYEIAVCCYERKDTSVAPARASRR